MAEYAPVASDIEAVTAPVYNTDELFLIRRSSRFVIALCFLQLGLALINLLAGGFIMMIVSALFISFGIVGAAKLRVGLLIAHFVYSLAVYILSLIVVVLALLNLTAPWYCYLFAFALLLSQAIGLKHSRILIALLKSKCANKCVSKCNKVCASASPKPDQEVEISIPAIQANQFPMYPMSQMYMQAQNGQPQFYPFAQPVQYPFYHPQANAQQVDSTQQLQSPQPQQPIGYYPVSYGQI